MRSLTYPIVSHPMSVPHHPTKYNSPSILNASAFVDYHRTEGAYRDQPTPLAAIMCYHRGFAERAMERYLGRVIHGFFGDTIVFERGGGRIALAANFGIGSPVAAVILEDLLALGTQHVVSIGTTGTLSADLAIGDVLLVDRAFRDEGTSHHYLPADTTVAPDASLTEALAAQLAVRGTPHARGAVWTTDAPYRETLDEVRSFAAQGACAVEMEAAALFAVGQARSAAVASLLTISDSLADPEGWVPSFHGDATLTGLDTVFDVAFDVLEQQLTAAPALS